MAPVNALEEKRNDPDHGLHRPRGFILPLKRPTHTLGHMNKTQNTAKFFAFLLGIHLLATLYVALIGAPAFHLSSALVACVVASLIGAAAFGLGQQRAEFKHSDGSLAFSAALCWSFFQSSSSHLGSIAGLALLSVMAAALGWRGGALIKSNRAQQSIQPDGPTSGGSAG